LALQGAQRQTMIASKLIQSQSSSLEFSHQSFDLFTASSLRSATFAVFRRPDISPKYHLPDGAGADGMTLAFKPRPTENSKRVIGAIQVHESEGLLR
jgi:hypothetical protein